MPDAGVQPLLLNLLDTAERAVRHYFKTKPRGMWGQTLHAHLPDGRHVVIFAPLQDRKDKALLYAALRQELKYLGATAYCVSVESWQSPAFKTMEEADPWIGRMHAHPERLEVVMLMAVHKDGQNLMRVLIMKRARDGRVNDLERAAPDVENSAGNATNLLAHEA